MSFRNNGGWAIYADSQYTMGSPLTITDGNEAEPTIDGLGSLTNTTYRPKVSIQPYTVGTNLITPFVDGQVTFYRVFFFATPDTNNTIVFLHFRLPGSFNVVTMQANLARGIGIRQSITLAVPIFHDSVTVTNGLELWLETQGGDVDIDTITLMTIEDFIPV